MAKRDKLYTVNKWNKPFFEEERRRKLYPLGGDLTNNPIYGLRTGQAGLRWGYGDTGGTDYTAPVSNLAKQNSLDRAVTTFNQYSNPSYYQDIARTNYVYGWDKPLYGGSSDNSSVSNPPEYKVESYNPNWLDNVSKITNGIANTAKTAIDAIKTTNTINSQIDSLASAASATPKFLQGVTAPLSNTLMKSNLDKMTSDFGKTLNDLSTLKITDNSGLKHLSLNPKSVTKAGGISNIGKTGVGIGASILGEVGGNLISDGFNTVPGTLINQIGSAAGSVLSMIPGVGWVWGPAVTLGSKLLGGLYNRAFGSEYRDNGATAYTDRLNAFNPYGSSEYLADLMSSTGLAGPRATSRNGWLNHSAERRADRTNARQDLAIARFQRGIRNSIIENNQDQLQNAYATYTAMGGRLNRKKCNCKATGGFLNNAILDSASATGYNFLSDLTNMQMQNNQNKQDMGSSLGNSFTGLSNGTLFANGGGININPAHKGEFTAKAKRHGMGVQQFANHVLAHKDKFPTSTIRQAVFAKNSNTWKKAFGGKLNYGKDQDIRDGGFFDGQTLYAIGGPLQAMSSNWSPGGNVTEINAGGQHEENPYEGVQVGVDPEGTPNLVEENEVIWNDYVFSNRLKVPKEVCKELRVGQKKDGFTFAEVAKKLLAESKERPNDPISKRGLDANMQKLEDAQEELKQKMEAEEAVEQFNSLPPEQQVAIMQQEGEKAQDAVAQEQMAQQIQNLPPEQQQAIAQQMAMQQAQQQGMPQGMSPEEQYAMQQQAMQDQAAQEQYAQQRDARNQEILAQAAAMQDQAINSSAMGGKLCFGGKLFAEGGELNGQPQTEPDATQQDTEMAKYSDEELQDMIDDYQEAESGEVKVTKGKLARLRKKAEKAQAELERRHAEENEEQPQEARQEPSQEELQAAAQEQAMQAQQPVEGQPQEGMSPEQAMMMQQQMGGQPQMSPEEMTATEQQGQYGCGGRLYLTGGQLAKALGYSNTKDAKFIQDLLNITDWNAQINPDDPKLNEVYSKVKNPTIKHLLKQGWTPFNNGVVANEDWYEDKAGDADNWMQAGRYKTNGYNQDDLTALAARYPYMQDVINNNFTDRDWKKQGNITPKEMQAAIDGSAMWRSTNQWLADPTYGQQRMVDYITRRRNLDKESVDTRFIDKWNQYGTFVDDGNGSYTYRLKDEDGIGDKFSQAFWKARGDGLLGTMFDVRVPANPVTHNFILDENGNPTDIESFDPEADGYVRVGNPYTFYTTGTDENNTFAPGVNNTISYWRKNDSQLAGNSSNDVADNNSNYLTVGWQPRTNWTDYMLGALPGLTGLGMMFAQGKPDMSGIEAAANAYANSMGTMAPIHLTHGYMRPAIIDPRVTHNTLTASRLGTNRMLRNTGSAPSQAASILANDMNYQQQMGQNDLRDWMANREQEQKAAVFNEGIARANATFLNQGDQFNAQMLANAGERYANARYNAEKEKLAQENAWRAGILGNIGSAMTGLYNAYREGQNRNERDLLLASGVFGETNPFLENYYGISKVDPKTGKVIRGLNTGQYWYNGDYHNQPQMAISAKGGKLNRKNKKKKGYTF